MPIGRPDPWITKTCLNCDSDFTVKKWAEFRVYCSSSCYHAHCRGKAHPHNRRVDLVCAGCGGSFSVPESKAKRGQKCCSRECDGKVRFESEPRNARQMSDVEAAWLAGLFDGEGSISISARQRRDKNPFYRLTIANTDFPLMERIKEVTGVHTVTVRPRSNPRHKTICYWQASGADSLSLLRQMRPWLIVKAERADLALARKWFPRITKMGRIHADKPDPAVHMELAE